MSKSLQRISENQQRSKRKESTAVKEQKLLDAFCDIRSHITLLHKEQRHRQTDKIDQNHQHDRADDRENHRNFHAILNSVNFAGSEVLAGVGRKCCAKSFKRLCKDHQDLHSSIDCHNGIGAEQVYWQIVVALIAGIAAKEVVVSSCSVLFGVQNITTTDGMSTMVATLGALGFGAANAYALMVFCLLYIPCTATIATINREVESKKLTALIIFFQFAVAWVMSFLVYHIGLLF